MGSIPVRGISGSHVASIIGLRIRKQGLPYAPQSQVTGSGDR